MRIGGNSCHLPVQNGCSEVIEDIISSWHSYNWRKVGNVLGNPSKPQISVGCEGWLLCYRGHTVDWVNVWSGAVVHVSAGTWRPRCEEHVCQVSEWCITVWNKVQVTGCPALPQKHLNVKLFCCLIVSMTALILQMQVIRITNSSCFPCLWHTKCKQIIY